MDAITLLKQDHQTVAQLFTRFQAAGDEAYDTKRQIVERIIEELSVHAAIEELVFYPQARREVKGVEDMALESLEEHHIVKWLLSELEGMDPRAERYDAKVTVLIENVRHHVEEEESDFFPKVRDQLGRNRLAEMGDELAAAKRTAPTRPHPRFPDTPPGNMIAGTASGLVDKATDAVKGVVSDAVSRVTRSGEDAVGAVEDKASDVKDAAEKTVRSAATTTKRTARKAASTTKRAARKAPAKAKAKPAKKRASASGRRATSTTKRTAKRATSTAKRTPARATSAAKRTTKKATTTAKKASSTAKRTTRKATKAPARTTSASKATARKATSTSKRTTRKATASR